MQGLQHWMNAKSTGPSYSCWENSRSAVSRQSNSVSVGKLCGFGPLADLQAGSGLEWLSGMGRFWNFHSFRQKIDEDTRFQEDRSCSRLAVRSSEDSDYQLNGLDSSTGLQAGIKMEAYFRLPDGKQSFSPFEGECQETPIDGSPLA